MLSSSNSLLLFATFFAIARSTHVVEDVTGPQMTLPVGSGSADLESSSSSVVLNLPDVTRPRNLFHKYMTRGLYQCGSKYVHTFTKLQALIREAFEEYKACEELAKLAPARKSTESQMLDQLLADMDDSEAESENFQSSKRGSARDGEARVMQQKRSSLLRLLRSRRSTIAHLP